MILCDVMATVTAPVLQGDIVVSGVVMKEWQRTPKKLVEEWCQKQKRPRPYYNRANSNGTQKSEGSTGNVRCWLTLPDPKKPDKLSLKFLTEQGFATSLEAEHAAALLALHHINPGLPHERVLPEPYRTMWLQLVGKSDSAGGGEEEEGKGGKKGKKMAAWRVAEEEKKAAAEALRLEQEKLEVWLFAFSLSLYLLLILFYTTIMLCILIYICVLLALMRYRRLLVK